MKIRQTLTRLTAWLLCLILIAGQPASAAAAFKLPASLIAIEEDAFLSDESITGLIVLSDNLEEVGANAFSGTGLYALEVPEKTLSVAEQGLSSYAYLYVRGNDTVLSEGDVGAAKYVFAPSGSRTQIMCTANGYPFIDSASLVLADGFYYQVAAGQATLLCAYDATTLPGSVTIPETVGDASVAAVSENAFFGCNALTAVSLPYGITVADGALSGCPNAVVTYYGEPEAQPLAASIALVSEDETDFFTGMTARWSVDVTGGVSPYKTKFDVYCDGALLTSGSYSSATELSYTFSAAGTYHVVASVRDSEYNVVTAQSEPVTVTLTNAKIESVTRDCETPEPLRGTTVTWTVTPGAGLAPFQYGFTLKRNGTNYALQTYSEENTFSATLADEGTYQLIVRMKDANNTTDTLYTDEITVLPPLPLSFECDADTLCTEQEITWTLVLSEPLYEPYAARVTLYDMDGAELKTCEGTTLSYTFSDPSDVYTLSGMVYGNGTSNTCTEDFSVAYRPVKITGVMASPGEAICMGDSVDFSVTLDGALGAYSLLYEITDVAAETVVSTAVRNDLETPFTYTFTAGGEHTLDVHVIATDSQDVQTTLDSASVTYAVGYHTLSLDAITCDAIENAAQTGETLTWRVQASGGDWQYEYLYILWRDGEEVDFRAYSSENAYTFTPVDAGEYTLEVRVRDGRNSTATGTSDAVTVSLCPLEVSAFTADTDMYLGDTAHVSLEATGGRLPLTYSFEVLDAEETQLALQAFSSSTTFEFTPEAAGAYTLNATVRDGAGTTITKSETLNVYAPLSITSLSVNPADIYVDTCATFTALTEGGMQPLSYVFDVYSSEGGPFWQHATGESNTTAFLPNIIDTYKVVVTVTDALGTTLTCTEMLGVYEALSASLNTMADAQTIGDPVTYSIDATGGKAPISYAFAVKTPDGNAVDTQSDTNTFWFTPEMLGDYVITAAATDAIGETITLTHTLTVYKPLTNAVISATSPNWIYTGETASFVLTPDGGLEPLSYEFAVTNEAGEIVAEQLPGAESTFSVTLDTAGEYIVTGKINGIASAYPLLVFDPLTDAQLQSSEPSIRYDETELFMFQSVTGGIEPLAFSFSAVNAAGETVATQDFFSENAFYFTPGNADDYTITATVRDARENTLSTTASLHVYEQMLLSDLASDVTETRAGCNVTWSVVRTEGHDTAQYTWNVLRDGAVESTCYTDVPELVYAPQEMGTYTVEVTADDGLETVTVSGTNVNVLRAYTPLSDFSFATYFGAYGITGYRGSDDHIIIPPTDANGKAITAIHVNAFNSKQNIVTVELPDTITYLGMSAFGNCSNLKNINLPPKWNLTEFSAESANITTGPFSGTAIEHITIPSTMTFIPKAAFGGMEHLKSVTLHDGITSIGNFAFNYCSSLTDITLPESITALGARTFSGCTSLTSINYPAKLERIYVGISGSSYNYIYEGPFSGSGITSITVPEGVTALPGYIFSDMPSVKTISLPSTLTSIGTDAFDNCPALEEIILANGNTSFVIHDGALMDAAKTKIYCYPKSRAGSFSMPETLTSITTEQFKDCTKLESVTLHDGVTDIGNDAFMGCTNLTSINIPAGVTAIYPNTFKNCVSLKTITLSPALTSIYSNAFENCTALTQLVIPSSVTDIRDNVFKGCTSLTIYCVHNSAAHTHALKYGIPYIATASPADFDYTGSTSSTGSSCTIDRYVGSASSVIIPETIDGMKVTAIGEGAFEGNTTVTEIYIPDGVKSIGEDAFANCTSLKLLHVPSTVTSFQSNSLTNTPSDLIIYGPAGPTYSYACAANRVFMPCTLSNNEWTIGSGGYYLFPDQTLTIPAKLAGYPVTTIVNAFDAASVEFTMSGVVIPEGVRSIGHYAFYGCSALTEIDLPESVTFIGEYAFNNCSALKSATLPSGLTALPESIFEGCSALTEITIPAGVTSIGKYAFKACTTLKNVTIPGSVTSIGHYAFYGCSALTEIDLPKSVTSIGEYAFNNCSALKSATLPSGLTELPDGIFRSCSALEEITIPAGVTSIPDDAFYLCTSLEKVTLPEGLTSIGYSAFEECPLSSIDLPDSIETIDSYAFYECDLDELTLPASLTTIGDWAFESNDLTEITIPENVTCIGESAFDINSTLSTVIIPESVTDIGTNAFANCSDDLVIYCKEGSAAHTYAQDNEISYAIYSWDVLDNTSSIISYSGTAKNITIPAILENAPVTCIGESVFKNNLDLVSVTLPDSMRELGGYAFEGCQLLSEISMPQTMDSISYMAFSGCISLSSIVIPEGITSLNSSVLFGCSSLTDVSLPSTLTTIADSAFANCSALTEIVIPESVTTLGTNAFSRCSSLKRAGIPEGVKTLPYGLFYMCSALEEVTLPSTLTTIEGNAFYSCRTLSSIDVPASVRSIGEGAFSWTPIASISLPEGIVSIEKNTFSYCQSLTSLTIPSSVKLIGEGALSNCTALKSICIPASVTRIENDAFLNTDNVTFYCEENTAAHIYAVDNSIPYALYRIDDTAQGVIFTGSPNASGDYVVPATLGGYPVTEIADSAFQNNTTLTSIVIPDGVTRIGIDAFNGCTALETIDLPDSLETIGVYAFYQSGLTSVTLPKSLTSLPSSVFDDCDSLTTVTFEGDVTSIGMYAFSNCNALTTITLPETVTSIGQGAFRDCTQLPTINIPAGVTEIANETFYECKSLGEITIPDGVTTIGEVAFWRSGIPAITLPSTVTTIGDLAFEECANLTFAAIPASVTKIGTNVFMNASEDLVIYCEEGSVAYSYATDNSIAFRTYTADHNAKTILFPGDPSASGEYAIPETFLGYTVVGIAAFAFQDNTAITSITMPDTVTRIEQNAFTGCTNLASVDFSDTLDFVGWEAFKDCTALTEIALPDTVKCIIDGAFSGCTKLASVSLPDELDTLGRWVFQDCTSLTSIVLPKNLTQLSNLLFSGCTNLSSVTMPDALESIGGAAFMSCASLESITIPETVTTLGDSSFFGCSALKRIVIPEGVTVIPDMCFYGCSVLESVSLPSTLTSINFCAFDSCMALSSIDIPDSVTFIGQSAFSSCESLTAIELPKSLKTIDYAAFIQCPFTEITFPASLETIGEMAFGYNNFTQLTIPGNVKTLGNHAFYGNYELESVVIEEGVETLGTNVFWNCWKLTSAIIPDSVTSIGDKCFEGCPSDLTIYCSEGSAAQTHAIENDILYNTTRATDFTYTIANGECTINRYGGSSKNVIIPATIEGAPVTALGYNVFAGNTTLESVIVPDSVTDIGYYTFANCPALKSVYLPADITYDYELAPFRDGKYPFEGCSSKLTVYGPYDATLSEMISWYGDTYFPFVPVDGGVEIVDGASVYSHYTYTTLNIPAKLGKYQIVSIGDNAFSEALTYIQNIVVPDGVTNIGYEAFYRNDRLESVTISDTVSSIGERAFGYCSALKTAKLPRYLSEISAYLFQSCTALESVTMPENVYSIGNYAFSSCSKLTDITLPNTLETIGDYAFCLTGLKNVLLPDSVTSIGNYAFSTDVYVAEGSAAHTACQSATDLSAIVYRLDEATQTAAIVDCIRTSTNSAITCSVTLPESIHGYPVTEIADYAFDGCDFLASVVIPDSVTNVGGFALRNCTALTSVTLPANMTAVLPGLFYGCSKLTSVTLPESIVSIGSFAFTGASITTLDLPETVTTLEPWAFDGLSTLTSIFLPEGLTTIGASAFQGCAELTEITLPQTLTSLGSSAFSHCTSLTGIVLPDTLTSISDFTFNSCMSLTSVTLPANVISIGESAFLSCPITSLAFPDTLETIGNSAFLNSTCASVFVIPTSVTYIGDGAFDSTDTIYCEENSAAHTYAVNNSIPFVLFSVDTTTGEATFVSDANASGEYIVPAFYGSHPVTAIGNYAFESNKTITAVTIPEGVTTIGASAFYNCTALESILLPQTLTTLKTDVFDSCKALKSIVIPEGVTTLPGMCFRLCTSLTDVTLPASLTTILPSAFVSCGSLTSLTLPSSITDIRDEAITACSNLTIYCEENSAAHTYASNNNIPFVLFSVDAQTGEAALVSGAGASGDYVVPACYGSHPVTAVADSAFDGNEAITSVTLPDGITRIGEFAFLGCTELTSVTLPDSLTSIGYNAFNSCSMLTSIVIPDSVTSIDTYAFQSCAALTSVKLSANLSQLNDGLFAACTQLSAITIPETVTSIGSTVFYNCTALTGITIPASVASIGSYAFNNCTALTDLYIPSTVKTIGEKAFDGCTNLKLIFVAGSAASTYVSADPVPYLAYWVDEQAQTSVFCIDTTASGNYVVPTTFEGYPVTEIAPCAFQGNTAVTSITLPDTVTIIGDFAFEGCTSLASVNIPDGVTTLGNHAFTNCDALTILTLPDSIMSIDRYAFSSCSALKSINLPAKLTQLSDGLFSSCTQLEAIMIPETVTSIGSTVFYSCSSLTGITIPASVASIGSSAFCNCTSLTDFYIPSTVKTIGEKAFDGCTNLKLIFVAGSAASTYVSADPVPYLAYWVDEQAQTSVFCIDTTASGSYVVPTTFEGYPVTEIDPCAFQGNTVVTSITLPDTVTLIGDFAFEGCTSLASVNIPDGVTTLGNHAFTNCDALTILTLPDSIMSIDRYAFSSCSTLKSINLPANLTQLSDGLFSSCTQLAAITIPETVTSIGSYAFYSCTSLATAVIPPSVTSINENAFDGCSSNLTMYCEEGSAAYIYAGTHSFNVKLIVSGLTYTLSDTACTITGYLGSSPDVVIPESIGGLPVTTLATSSFNCNPKIQSVSIPSSVTTIELDAFYQCSRLERVNIPASVTSFGDFAFMECTKLTDVTFEEGRTELNANYLFHSCDALTEIKLPESLTTLSGYAFGNAIALERIYIPESVQTIGTNVFYGCPTTMTIHCVSGSAAHTFAEEKEFGVSFTTF